MIRHAWINKEDDVAISRQCKLAGVSRATVYARQKPKDVDEDDELLKGLIDEEYTRHPFYGTRRMVVYLGRCGHTVNRKRTQRLMRAIGLAGMAPGPNTSKTHPQHKVYPYLLRGVAIERPNQVWSTAIPHPAGSRLCLPGGHHRLVFPVRAELAHQQQHGGGVLRGLPGRGFAPVRQA